MSNGKDLKIHLEHVTRIEGHGNVVLDAKDGKVQSVQWQVPEAPRFFEAMVVGRDYFELSHITSRICGICSIGHSLASIKASEAAMGVKITRQTRMLRKLALHAETIQSHILHVGYLVAPDLLGVGSVFPLINTHKDAVVKIVGIHRLANEMSDLLCGRTTHPITLTVGGFTKVPKAKELKAIKSRLEASVAPAKDIIGIVLSQAGKLPNFTRPTEYIGLVADKEYAFYDGMIGSTDTGKHPVEDYLQITNEFVVPHSTAKFSRHKRDAYMAGALARYNLNSKLLSPLGKEVEKMFGLQAPCYNPFMNNVAQIVELAHCMEESIEMIDQLVDWGLEDEKVEVEVKAGRGVGAVEVPRGILFHEYTIDRNGKCVKANCIIPTNQNHLNIQKDMEALAPTLISKSKGEIELNLEMLVRAYDPCVSCSTHYLKVDFV
jgi:sulfhydrogenase subunit alpha